MYAVIDIETTGGKAHENRIIEIAVAVHDGTRVVDYFESLVNPGMRIPRFISNFTGISNEMVENAPTFADISDRISDMTTGCVFVAHNVNFDYSFVQQEFRSIGKKFERRRICTIRLSRKVFPDMPSYSLGNLCRQLQITSENFHRAGDDTRATVKLLEKILANDKQNVVQEAIRKSSGEALLPPNLNRDDYDNLPNEPGVYYFLDKKKRVIYVGKAKNIKSRIKSHFGARSDSRKKVDFMNEIHRIRFRTCGNELVSFLLEASEISRLWPKYNNAIKGPKISFGVFTYYDRNGYNRLAIQKVQRLGKPLVQFRSVPEARQFLEEKAKEYSLCLKLCNLQSLEGKCSHVEEQICYGACQSDEPYHTYNERVTKAISSFLEDSPSFVIFGKGRVEGESSYVMVENGTYLGFGFIQDEKTNTIFEPELLKGFLERHPHDHHAESIIGYFLQNPQPHDRLIEYTPVSEAEDELMAIGLFA